MDGLVRDKVTFVHYTSAANAHLILSNSEFWLRNARVMNDFSEVDHGMRLLACMVGGNAGRTLRSALEAVNSALADRVFNLVNDWQKVFYTNTFMGCLSEHNATDDQFGQLSMWRAYGGDAGAALVIDAQNIAALPSDRGIMLYPVLYGNGKEIEDELVAFAEHIDAHRQQLQMLPIDTVVEYCVDWFRVTGCTTKHPAFKEEREWRLLALYLPLAPKLLLPIEVALVRGIPQRVFKLRLIDHQSPIDIDLSIPNLISEVLVGPCEDPNEVMHALAHDLIKAGFEREKAKVRQTMIPLRKS